MTKCYIVELAKKVQMKDEILTISYIVPYISFILSWEANPWLGSPLPVKACWESQQPSLQFLAQIN